MKRRPGPSVRLRLALSYAAFLMVVSVLLLAVVWVFLLRYVPDQAVTVGEQWGPDGRTGGRGLFVPGRSDLWRAFWPKAAWMLAFLLALGLGGGWLLAGRMLAPLDRITEATRRASEGSLAHRIKLPGHRDEFRELADAFDVMLGRLEAHVAEQQRFAANASHELRTPLATTRALLEVAERDPDRDVDALVQRLQHVNTRAIELTEALLLLSRADRRAFAPERVDLSLVAEDAAETLMPLATRHRVTIEVAGEAAYATGSQALLQQLAMNLVHNAIVHNVPEGGVVRVRSERGADRVRLVVESTGEVLAPDLVATFVEPFQRGTERRHADQAGAGLGLAIVERIVAAHDGDLTLSPRPEGGLSVMVELPGQR